jgi:hypothetical protein
LKVIFSFLFLIFSHTKKLTKQKYFLESKRMFKRIFNFKKIMEIIKKNKFFKYSTTTILFSGLLFKSSSKVKEFELPKENFIGFYKEVLVEGDKT